MVAGPRIELGTRGFSVPCVSGEKSNTDKLSNTYRRKLQIMAAKRRTKGTGTLFKKNNGRYALRYEDIDGAIKTVTLKNDNGRPITLKHEAEKAADKLIQELFKLQQLDSKAEYLAKVASVKQLIVQKRIAPGKLWEHYLSTPNRPESGVETLKSYHGILKKFLQYCKSKHIEAISGVTAEIASAYMMELWNQNISSRTYNKHLQALKLIFKTVLPDNSPFAELKAKLLEQESRKAFSREQINAIFAKLDDPEFYLLYKDEMRIVLMLGLCFGLRLHDAVCFQWSYIKGDTVEFKPAKTKRRQREALILPIPPILQQQFERAAHWKQDEYVLPNVARRYQINSSGISQDIAKLLKAAGIETLETASNATRRQKYRNSSGKLCSRHIGRYSYHSFRHTFCTIAANAGKDLAIIRSIVGHANIQMTSHYTHYSLESKRQVIESLPLPDSQKNLLLPISFAEVICNLPAEKLPHLARHLEAILTPEQQSNLIHSLKA